MKKKEKEVKKTSKCKCLKELEDIKFDIEIGVTHADNPENAQYLLGEKSMLEKVKKALS